MKKIILLIFISLNLFYFAKAQTPIVRDTIGRLKKIEYFKNNYIGQPFSKLLNELAMTFVTFSPVMSNPSDVSKEPSTNFMFLVPTKAKDYRYAHVSIVWQSPLNFDTSIAIARSSATFGSWDSTAIAYYQNVIVGDIIIGGDGSTRPAPPGGYENWNGEWYTPTPPPSPAATAGKNLIKTKSKSK